MISSLWMHVGPNHPHLRLYSVHGIRFGLWSKSSFVLVGLELLNLPFLSSQNNMRRTVRSKRCAGPNNADKSNRLPYLTLFFRRRLHLFLFKVCLFYHNIFYKKILFIYINKGYSYNLYILWIKNNT